MLTEQEINTAVRQFVQICEENDLSFSVGLIKGAAVKRPGIDDAVVTSCRRNNLTTTELFSNYPETASFAKDFYAEHVGKPFFPDLENSLNDPNTGRFGTLSFIIFAKGNTEWTATTKWRKLIGATNSRNAELGTLRSMFGGHRFDPNAPMADNAFHGSDSRESAIRELGVILKHGFRSVNYLYQAAACNRLATDKQAPRQEEPTIETQSSRENSLLAVFEKVQDILVGKRIAPTRMRAEITYGGIVVRYDRLFEVDDPVAFQSKNPFKIDIEEVIVRTKHRY